MQDWLVDGDGVGERLDSYLARRLEQTSRQKIQKLIKSGQIRVNNADVQVKYQVQEGDRVTIDWTPPPPESVLVPVEMPLDIIFEDTHVIVLNKPAGVSVHPGAGDTGPTLVQGLLHHVGVLPVSNAEETGFEDSLAWARPGIVHRLDKDTTGVMVAAKTDLAHRGLSQQFQAKETLKRQYCALLDGTLRETSFFYESYLGRDIQERTRFQSRTPEEFSAMPQKSQGGYRYAKSMFHVDKVFGERLSYVKVRLFTGRTHQIRVHAQALGAPIIGDVAYGRTLQLPKGFPQGVGQRLSGLKRQLLHAELIEFHHPVSGEVMSFTAPLPVDFAECLRELVKVFK